MFAALLVGTAIVLFAAGYRALAADRPPAERRAAAIKAQQEGNFRDALDGFAKLVTDPADDATEAPNDLSHAVECLQHLARVDEIDDLREKAVTVHAKNWRLLERAARTYQDVEHQGFIVAGQFYRGGRRGNDGKPVHAFERDRVRALQLMQQAKNAANDEKDKHEVAEFYFRFSDMLLDRRFGQGAWRLQCLSDLSTLPDYEEGYPYAYYGYNPGRGAPVDEKGEPVYHHTPKSWESSKTDGERWRWCLTQSAELAPSESSRSTYTFASFLREQFDVQTMAQSAYPIPFGRRGGTGRGMPGPVAAEDDTRQDESGPYAVSTLGEDETIARLANGIKRFKLPDEFNFIKICRGLADVPNAAYAQHAEQLLATSFEDRQQYDKAAECWQVCLDRGWSPDVAKARRDQIVGYWGEFDPTQTAPAGKEPKLGFLFRNGTHVAFTARPIDVRKLLDDMKAYVKTKPNQLDWQRMRIDDIGYRLVVENQNQYLGKQVAQWEMDLKPRDKHFDRRVSVTAPLKAGGAYLVEAKMKDGNTTRVVVWVGDLALVKKALDGGSYYFAADAATGAPAGKVKLDFFGWQQRWLGDGKNYEIRTDEFAKTTDADGQLPLKGKQDEQQYQWLVTATGDDGRLAYLGFTGIWAPPYNAYEQAYNMTKAFTITDRPVYRPGQPVRFKTWVGQTQYDKEGRSPTAGQAYTVRITDPRGEKLLEKNFTADNYGGFDGEITLTKEATLGQYAIQIVNAPINQAGGGMFRVEEYKKPEFEVKVDAPTEPVMLGERITATIKANYYFGAPVTQAKVKYKVMRSTYRAEWYPAGRWDWFYEPGYWWFAADYPWFPGWREWGMRRPVPSWFGGRGPEQPEIVAENEVPVGPDGTVKVEIDTAPAKALHGDSDHKYEITAEVTDASRRTITGTGTVSVARKPFKVYAWVDRGYYNAGDPIEADFSAQTIDNKPIKGKGELKLLSISYGPDLAPSEKVVQTWQVNTDDQGKARQQIKADRPGQYRLSYTVTDDKGHAIEGGYVFVVRGGGFTGKDFRFNDLELVPDKKEYAPGDRVNLQVNSNRDGGTVLLFVRPTNGVYLAPKLIRLNGKSTVEAIDVAKKDMPNFFVEAVTVSNGKVFTEARELVVPPENRVVNVQVLPSQSQYKPGEKAKVTFKLTDDNGKPVSGSAVASLYDKSVEYISGGSNVPEIKSFFWKWRRSHYPATESSLFRGSGALHRNNEVAMGYLGMFGRMVADLPLGDELVAVDAETRSESTVLAAGGAMPAPSAAPGGRGFGGGGGMLRGNLAYAPMAARKVAAQEGYFADRLADKDASGAAAGEPPAEVAATVRTKFADTALWVAAIDAGPDGTAQVELTMPENLTTWKAKVWSMSAGTRVGEGSAEVTTYKNLILRLQAPRFFVQKDEVVLSANVHNYLKAAKRVKVELALDGGCLEPVVPDGGPNAGAPANPYVSFAEVQPNGEARIDWRVRVLKPGQATVKMSALTDEESDATQMSFPVYVHGMLKTESYSGAIRPDQHGASLTFNVPKERLPEQSRVEVRYSPSVASAMVDALPYLVDYPYGCTEQTLNRFLPTVITQRVLLNMNLDLKDIEKKRTNLNAQEIGEDAKRAADWRRNNPPNPGITERNPVFDADAVRDMSAEGLRRLANMQNADGGWGWFSGFGEQSWPHTTATVVHGLQIARENDLTIPAGVLERGVEWLKRYQAEQVAMIKRAPAQVHPYKLKADNLDALVYMVLADAKAQGNDVNDMREFLYRDRNELAVYCKAQFALALVKEGGQQEKVDMLLRNIDQYLVKDAENQTAYLKLPEGNAWYYWYGSDTEANAYYLKLLSKTQPKGDVAPLLAKYLINNRKHASYWNSTRDTALCIEALSDFIKASGEDRPDLTLVVKLDGRPAKEVKINAGNFFSFDNRLVLTADQVSDGPHKIEFEKTGTGVVYFNAYVTNFTLEDPIRKAGLEIKVDRKFYKLVEAEKTVKVSGARGQALDQRVEKYERKELKDLSTVTSGDLVEVELEIDSKNDYEYVLFEDMKASGFEPVEVRSGYNGNDLNAYMELRDERVCFFARTLARGKHSVSYRLRAEIPGRFSALPTKASAMYAPELKANSDEFKVNVQDAPEVKGK